MRRKETSRIRTATNFLRRSAGPSEDALHSSVTNVADFRVLQTSHSPLKIGGKTLSLSIAAKKCTVVAWQRRLQAAVDLTSRRCVFLNFFIWGLGLQCAILVRNETSEPLHLGYNLPPTPAPCSSGIAWCVPKSLPKIPTKTSKNGKRRGRVEKRV